MKDKRVTTWGERVIRSMKKLWNSLLYSMMFMNYDK